jgi:hypothetical protein
VTDTTGMALAAVESMAPNKIAEAKTIFFICLPP